MSLLALTTSISAQQENIQSKELSISRSLSPHSRIIIDQIGRKLIVKASPDNTIRLVTTVFYQGKNAVTDAEWWDYLNLQVKEIAGLVSIQPVQIHFGNGIKKRITEKFTGDPESNTGSDTALIQFDSANRKITRKAVVQFSTGTGVAQFDSAGKWLNRKSNIRRDLIVYLPANSRLQVENQTGDVVIETGLEELNAVIDHASLTMEDVSRLVLRSNYGHIISRDIKDATINITRGKWSGRKADKLKITSRSSSIELGSTEDATVDSGDDQYDIDEIKTIHGSKNFGDLRVLELSGSMDITGNSADIKLRSVAGTVSLINIDNQFADVKLPLTNLKNYSIDFKGKLSKIYAPFALPENKDNITTSAGDKKSAHTTIQLKCLNCTVDFQ